MKANLNLGSVGEMQIYDILILLTRQYPDLLCSVMLWVVNDGEWSAFL